MKINKLFAFTLVEILIVLTIIGFLSVIALRNLTSNNFKTKQFQASAYKVVEEFQSASIKIREIETNKCPTGEFATNIMGDMEFSLYSAPSVLATSEDVLNLYSNYLKMENKGADFCSHTKAFSETYCTGEEDKTIKGARISENMYIGIEVISNPETGALADCPNYYRVNPNEEVTGTGKCWGRLYLDANGIEGPNKYGEDAFVFGLNASGIIY